ncbi:hypothetical protein ACH3XW_3855 [Acanthocheilonema viteae]
MPEQSSTPTREKSHRTQQREQTFHQLLHQLRLSGQNASSSSPELISSGFSISDAARQVIENVLTEGVHELLVPSSSSSSSSIQQSQLQAIIQQFQQRIQSSRQRYSDGNQYIIQLPVQSNQQSSGISQQSRAEQLLLQVSLQQPQQLSVVNPGNINTQMFLQVPQLQGNSNIPPLESSIASQQSHMQRAESLFRQPSQQSAQNVQQQNPQGNNHSLAELSQQTNQCLQSQQHLNGSQYQQQHIQGIQQSLLQLSQQVPILSLQQPLQQTQPLLVQILQQSSTTPQQPRPQQNHHPLIQVPQQPVQQRMPVHYPLQQVQSTQQALAQSLLLPSVQQPAQVFQQSNQAMPSFLLGIPREAAQVLQQTQSNQPPTSLQESASQSIQQMFRQMSQQSMSEVRGTNSEDLESTALLAQVRQKTQQQLNQQQTVQELLRSQLINWESMGIPLGILQVSEPQLQPSQQSSETVQKSLEIPDVSLFNLSPEHFMRVIQQCPYSRSSDQASSVQPFRQLRPSSFLQSCQASSPLGQLSSTQLTPQSLLQSDRQSSSLHHQSSTQFSLSPKNQIQVLPSEAAVSSNRSRSSAAILNDTVTTPSVIASINELRETFPEDSRYDEEPVNNERNDTSISEAETNISSISTVSGATTRLTNSNESHETMADNDSTVRTIPHTTEAIYVDSRHISGLNDNSLSVAHLTFDPTATLTQFLHNQQTESDIPEHNVVASSLLLNHFSSSNEINHLLGNNTNDNIETVESRNELDQILRDDILVAQEMANYLADQLAKIESLSCLLNSAMRTNDSSS